MGLSYQKCRKLVIACLLMFCVVGLFSVQLPVFLRWRSSNSYYFYSLDNHDASRIRQVYKINAGVDTLFANGVRTRLEITNLGKQLESQMIIEEALVGIQTESYVVMASMQDFGYGKRYFLYNRRNEDALFGENTLLNYRWHGLQAGYKAGSTSFGAGLAGNELNLFLAEANLGMVYQNAAISLFGVYTHKDNKYSVAAYDLGTEISYKTSDLAIRAGFTHHHIPVSKHLPEMNKWSLINEIKYQLLPVAALILSADIQKPENKDIPEYLLEGCLNLSHAKLMSNIGFRSQSVLSQKAQTVLLDIDYCLRSNLKMGIFCDFVNISNSDDYFKAGIQTSFTMD